MTKSRKICLFGGITILVILATVIGIKLFEKNQDAKTSANTSESNKVNEQTEHDSTDLGADTESSLEPTAASEAAATKEPAIKEAAPTITAQPTAPKQELVTVHNFKELAESIQSDREIQLLPGDYTSSESEHPRLKIEGVSNITLRGLTNEASEYIEIMTDPKYYFVISDCKDITLINLKFGVDDGKVGEGSYGECFVFGESENCTAEHCRIFQTLTFASAKHIRLTNCFLHVAPIGLYPNGENKNEDIQIADCTLVGDEGVCNYLNHIYGNDEPAPVDYTYWFGTQEWGRSQKNISIYYPNYELGDEGVTFSNTYNGSLSFCQDERIHNLQNKLNSMFSKYNVFVSQDSMATAENEVKPYNLNINIELASVNQEEKALSEILPKLYELRKELFYNADFMTVIVWQQDKYRAHMASLYELTRKDFETCRKENWDLSKTTTILKPAHSIFNRVNDSSKLSMAEEAEGLKTLLISKDTLELHQNEELPEEEQVVSSLFESQGLGKDSYYYAIESLFDTNECTLYRTDMVLRTDVETKACYITCEDGDYQLLDTTEKERKSYAACIEKYLDQVKDKPERVLDSNIAVKLKNVNHPEDTYVLYLRREKRDSNGYDYVKYNYYYEIAKLNVDGIVISTVPVTKRQLSDDSYTMACYTEAPNQVSSVNIQYPIFEGPHAEKLNEMILDKIECFLDYDSGYFEADTRLTMDIDARVTLLNRKMASIVFWGYSNVQGSAHPSTDLFTLNVDLQTMKEVGIFDLYDMKEEFQKVLFTKAQFPTDPITSYDEDCFKEMLELQKSEYTNGFNFSGASETCTYLKPDGIVISFSASHATGSDHCEAKLKYEDIQQFYKGKYEYWRE